ncbi:MAG: GHMP kinase [archaeon]
MIISRTPFRISFCGGGTDLQAFYQHEPGAVVSTAINKYMYITVNKKFDHHIRISYSKTENVESVHDIEHELIREAMKLTDVTKGVEITSVADIPAMGTGLGSSSSFTVGLLHALHAFSGNFKSAAVLAEEACHIEIDVVGEPIGKQDQYIAAFGGLQYVEFNTDGTVFVDPIICDPDTKAKLQDNLVMFYTGITRKAGGILSKQMKETKNKLPVLKKMRDLAIQTRDALNSNRIDQLGELLHENWLLKKGLTGGISNDEIDTLYEKARKAGATGGKILGAGGGGFLMFYAPGKAKERVRDALSDLREFEFQFEPQGSKIIYVGD